jgi:hypothetical protein
MILLWLLVRVWARRENRVLLERINGTSTERGLWAIPQLLILRRKIELLNSPDCPCHWWLASWFCCLSIYCILILNDRSLALIDHLALFTAIVSSINTVDTHSLVEATISGTFFEGIIIVVFLEMLSRDSWRSVKVLDSKITKLLRKAFYLSISSGTCCLLSWLSNNRWSVYNPDLHCIEYLIDLSHVHLWLLLCHRDYTLSWRCLKWTPWCPLIHVYLWL